MYAHEKLQETGEEQAYRDQHLKFFMGWVEEAEPKLKGVEQIIWWDRMEKDHNNIRSALEWSLSGGDVQMGLRLAGALMWFWKPRGYWREALQWLKDALARPASQPRTTARAKAMVVAGYMAQEMGTTDPIDAWFEESLEIFRENKENWWITFVLLCMGWHRIFLNKAISARDLFEEAVSFARRANDPWILGYALRSLGAMMERVDYEAARPILEESLLHTRLSGDRWTLGDVLKQLGTVAWGLGDYTQLLSLGEESLKLFREIGDQWMEAEGLMLPAAALLGQGDTPQARKLFEESLRLANSTGFILEIGHDLAWLGCVAEVEGQPRRAAMLLSASELVLNSVGTSSAAWPWAHSSFQQSRMRAKAQLGDIEFDRALVEGRAMPLKAAVRYALEEASDG